MIQTVRVWNAATGASLQILREHSHVVECVSFPINANDFAASSLAEASRALQEGENKVSPEISLCDTVVKAGALVWAGGAYGQVCRVCLERSDGEALEYCCWHVSHDFCKILLLASLLI